MESCDAKLILVHAAQDSVREHLLNTLAHTKLIYLESPTEDNRRRFDAIRTYCDEINHYMDALPSTSRAEDVKEIVSKSEIR